MEEIKILNKPNFTITILGDFYLNKDIDVNRFLSTNGKALNFLISRSDFSLLNLEAPILDKNSQRVKKTGPNLKLNYFTADLLLKLGIHGVTLANNHISDYGFEGLNETLNWLEANNLSYVGAGLTTNQILKPLSIRTVVGNIAILNFSENEWSTLEFEKGIGANPISFTENYYAIQEAKKENKFVLVITHAGHEYFNLPSPRMKKLFRFYIDIGADAIVNHHPHVISGFEIYKNKPIYYSVGNFLFDRNSEMNKDENIGMGVNLTFSENQITNHHVVFRQKPSKDVFVILRDHELESIENKIKYLNNNIACDKKLGNEFNKYVFSKKRQYLLYLDPISNRPLNLLRKISLFPYLHSSKRKRLLLNILRCESHLNLMQRVLEDEFSNS